MSPRVPMWYTRHNIYKTVNWDYIPSKKEDRESYGKQERTGVIAYLSAPRTFTRSADYPTLRLNHRAVSRAT